MKTPGIIVLFVSISIFYGVDCSMKLQPNEETEDCTNGKAKFIDWSQLLVEPVNDTLFYLNGEK